MTLSPSDLRAALQAGTPRPWTASTEPSNTGAVIVFGGDTGFPVAITSAVWNRDKELELADAALIVAAVNSLPEILDENERLINALVESQRAGAAVSIEAQRLAAEVERLTAALDEREGDMHMRIRLGYDKTVADTWRAENERLKALCLEACGIAWLALPDIPLDMSDEVNRIAAIKREVGK
jgi:hypothetical protein